jgi:orotate phosphoribosyltransferase-like protein
MVNKSRKRDNLMAKLNKTQKYAIQWLNSTGYASEAIAKELNLTVEQIESIIPKVDTPVADNKVQSISSAKDLMITHTSGKKINSVAIMTKEIVDTSNKNAPVINIDNKKGIFRPKK